MSQTCEIAPYEGETALVANAVVVLALVLHELAAVFVYCIVSEMHEEVIEVIIVRRYILLRSEAGESFTVNIDS
jgi:hypothetical protein